MKPNLKHILALPIRLALAIALPAAAIAIAVPLSAVEAYDSTEHLLERARVDAMQKATLAFLATLNDEQRASVMASLEDSATRTNWSNLPVSMAPRSGMAVAEMSGAQRRALHAMMAAAFSSQGYLKTTTSMWHEDVLRDMTANMLATMPDEDPDKAFYLSIIESYDSEKFFVSVFGEPSSKDWGWMVTGHHYGANFTVADGKIAFMPLFLGANPQIVPEGRYAGWMLLQHEADRAFALIESLETSQLQEAVVANAVDDNVFAGPGNSEAFNKSVGIKASSLGPLQLRLLNGVIDEYLGDASDEAAVRQRKAIDDDGLDTLYFAWWGPTNNPAARYMFRVHGPSILIDYVRERSVDGGYNHVHSIARDPSNDYGSEWLKLHYEEVRTGIFALTQDLFGVTIRPWKTDVWSDQAESYEIVENGEIVGRFYLDMHPRDGKYTHAAMFPVRAGIDGRIVPIAALVTNFPDGLMEHGQVETFLHEFGHLLHWIFAGKVEHAAQNSSELESDVTEAPSTLLEEWVWDYDTLKKFATNDKGEVIPEDLVKKMNAGRKFGKALRTMGQLGYAAISFDFYSKPMAGKDLGEVENAAAARYYPLKPVPGTHNYASFGHLTSYAASYYTYQWSEALASDLMSRFRTAGLRDKATANDYRNMILAPGGSASMNDLAREFLGRDWSVDSYREDLKRGAGE